MVNSTANIQQTFEDFYLNGSKIGGVIEVTKLFINPAGKPQANKTIDITITTKEGSVFTMKGEREREWIEGSATYDRADDVFLIAGAYSISDDNGEVYAHRIMEPLRRELSCPFIVKGTIEIFRNSRTVIIDYGDGACDALATLEVNGKLREITLKQKI
jgi:hypothetical protein